jgi:hypothetical protein
MIIPGKIRFVVAILLISCYKSMKGILKRGWGMSQVVVKRWAVDSPFERRKYRRLIAAFRVILARTDQTAEIEAVTHDISQTGSLIVTSDWQTFTQDERTNLRLFLPPDFTGQPSTLILRGPGIVRRLDADRNGIAVEFLRRLRTFDPSRELQE